jgi:uncharacterized protein (TIGR02285 family)
MKRAFKDKIKISYCLLLVALSSLATHSMAKEEIMWLGPNFPPAFINNGPGVNKGYMDIVERLIWQKNPDYKHSKESATFSRILNNLENRKNVCSAALFKTPEREKFITYSKPMYLVLSNGIIFQRSSLTKLRPYILEDNVISLEHLLQGDNAILGVSKNRSYGNKLNKIISNAQNKGAIYQRAGSNQLEGLLQMLRLNRIDFLIGYFHELQFIARQQNMNSNELMFYPVAELKSPFILGYIGCSKSKLGLEMIAKINSQAAPIRKTFLDHYANWLDKQTQKSHRRLTNNQFNE